ncbi:MAG: hypothetical protein F7B20_03745 [Aeropyrum sp.]|nr:hypothetical protein [Aeropyrum sp.]
MKLGAVPGVLGLAASLHLAGSGGQAGLLVEYLGLQEVTGLWVEALYHLTTVPALGGAFLLLAWRLGIAKGQQA